MTLSEKIRRLLKERDWSQSQLAQASGLDPSVLSRLLAGERAWRKEHIACTAAALSKTPEDLIEGTETTADNDNEMDSEFVATLTRAHGTLVGETTRLTAELADAKQRLNQYADEQQQQVQRIADLELALKREEQARVVSEQQKRTAEAQEYELVRQLSSIRAEHASVVAELQGTKQQLTRVQTEHANATQTANRNYAIAKDLEKKLSGAKGVATLTGLLGLAMVVGNSLNDSPRRRRRA